MKHVAFLDIMEATFQAHAYKDGHTNLHYTSSCSIHTHHPAHLSAGNTDNQTLLESALVGLSGPTIYSFTQIVFAPRPPSAPLVRED